MAKKVSPHPYKEAEGFEGLKLFGRAGRCVFEIHEHPISNFLLLATAVVDGHGPQQNSFVTKLQDLTLGC